MEKPYSSADSGLRQDSQRIVLDATGRLDLSSSSLAGLLLHAPHVLALAFGQSFLGRLAGLVCIADFV